MKSVIANIAERAREEGRDAYTVAREMGYEHEQALKVDMRVHKERSQ